MRLHPGEPGRGRGTRPGPLGWWSPDPRGILPLDGMTVHRSLRRAARRFTVTVDTAFTEVVRGCADRRRPGGWIDDSFVDAYTVLHDLGWAHSVEVWRDRPDDVAIDRARPRPDDVAIDRARDRPDDVAVDRARDRPDDVAAELVGGVYGVAIGGLFAGESMFHRTTDASKVALLALVERLRVGGGVLFDVQWRTPHLASLGVVEISRAEYGRRLADALTRPQLTLS